MFFIEWDRIDSFLITKYKQWCVWVCLIVTLHIVDLWHYYVCCIRSGVIRCTLSMVLYLTVCASTDITRCFGCMLIYLFASSLKNLSVPQRFYSPLSISVKRSCWPCIRWCGTGGFYEQVEWYFIGLSTRSIFIFSCSTFLLFISMGWYCVAWVFWLIGCQSLSPGLA